MKKITFLIALAFSAIVSAQTVSISTINGMTPADFLAATPNLVEGSTLEIVVAYDGFVDAAASASARLLDVWTPFPGTEVTNTVGAGSGTSTLMVTVPDVTADKGEVRIQAVGRDGGNTVFGVHGTYTIDDLTTLSSGDFSKAELEGAYYDGIGSIVVSGATGTYAIYNIAGVAVSEGTIAGDISAEELASGVYILATEAGVLKFVK